MISLVYSTFIKGTISVRDKESGEISAGNDLTDAVSGTHRGLFALPHHPPKSNIVHIAFSRKITLCKEAKNGYKCFNSCNTKYGTTGSPFSGRTKYCERVLNPETDATCKDIAVKLALCQRAEAKELCNKVRNRYQMRYSRPDNQKMRNDYNAWRKQTLLVLSKYHLGEIR